MPFFNFDRNKTLRPLKPHKNEKQKALHQYAAATLGSGDLRTAVALPEGEDENEWLAMHAVDLYNEISLLYGTVTEFCTRETCPTMSAGSRYEYLWADGVKITKPIKVSAPEYVDLLCQWVEEQLSDNKIFPQTTDTPFPKNFKAVLGQIFKRLFRVYAHIYTTHLDKIEQLGATAHLNTALKHFLYFTKQFGLVDAKELAPLDDLIWTLTGGYMGKQAEK